MPAISRTWWKKMCAATLPSDATPRLPARWADGAAEIGFADSGGETRLRHLYQSDPCRVLFPRPAPGAACEAVIVTTSGGIVGGDRLRFAIAAGAGTRATVTTQAAEKIYRSAGSDAGITVAVEAGADAVLEWMPQETILFDGARLRRETTVEAASGARLLGGEIVVFGRIARGERMAHGLLHDSWRVRLDGRLVWADALHLDGDVAAVLDRPFTFDGAVATATVFYVGPGADDLLDIAREALGSADDGCPAAASRLGPLLLVRFLGRDAAALRQAYARLWSVLRVAALGFPASLPRVWQI